MNMNPDNTNVFNMPFSINCRGKLLDLTTPRTMGILNLTPDSFYDGGKFTEEKGIMDQVAKMVNEGVAIIDIGAHSTRPGSAPVDESTEMQRLFPVLDEIIAEFPGVIISIDTYRSSVAQKAVEAGASIINDVSGGELDNRMFAVVAALKVPYILMHMKGLPANMQLDTQYENVVTEVYRYLGEKIQILRKSGCADIIVDPGFGFGKNVEQNFRLLSELKMFHFLGCPVLAGISRKSMICKVLGVNPANALNGTTALHMTALMNGANILRVHDVKEANETIKLFLELRKSTVI